MYWRKVKASPVDPRFNAVFRRRLVGSISDQAIGKALQAIVDRHEILRTRFCQDEDDTLYQEIVEGIVFKLDHVDLRPLPEDQRLSELMLLGSAFACKPFSFADGRSETPLFAALFVRIAPDEAHLILKFHTLVMDGWSLDMVVRELGELAAATDAGAEARLPPVSMHFGDYARWYADALKSEAIDTSRSYWRQKLQDLPDFGIAPDRVGRSEGKPSEICSILIPREVSDKFATLAKSRSHTLNSLATAAAAAALHQITGTSEAVFLTQSACREDPDAEFIVGPLMNPLILRVPMPRGNSFMKVADTVRSNLREAMEHQFLPFAEIEEMLSAQRGRQVPACRVGLTIQRTYISSGSVHDSKYGNFSIESVAAPAIAAQHDLNLFMVGREEGWRLSCEFPPELYDKTTIDALLSSWLHTIESAVESPEFVLRSHAAAEEFSLPDERVEPEEYVENPRIANLRERVLTLQRKGDLIPVISINNASVLYEVAKAIGPDHPFHDIQFCPSTTPVKLPRRHFADYARDAVEMIRLAQPHGPYVLFGFCITGAIAIEAARILQAEGECIELVVLNDTYRPGFRENLSVVDRFIRSWQVRYISTAKILKRMRSGELNFAQVLANFKIARALRLPHVATFLGSGGAQPVPDAMSDNNRWFPELVLMPSQADYEMKPYSGRVVLFRSQDVPNGRLFPRDFGWGPFVDGDFEVVDCPGTHDSMFRSAGASVIGSKVRRLIENED